jgi:hypothetical protein
MNIVDNRNARFVRIIHVAILLIALSVFGCGVNIGENRHSDNKSTAGKEDTSSSPKMSGSVTLRWAAPNTNANGGDLNDLAGYKVYYGPSSRNYTQSIDVGNYTGIAINDLPYGTWCFSVTAYDTAGNESGFSAELCKTLR